MFLLDIDTDINIGDSNIFIKITKMDSNTFGKVRKIGNSVRSREYFVKCDWDLKYLQLLNIILSTKD